MKNWWKWLILAMLLLIWPPIVACLDSDTEHISVSGIVVDADGPIDGAIVRIQATPHYVTTSPDGRFQITNLTPGKPITLTAWAPGYYIVGGDQFVPGEDDIELELVPLYTDDNPEYEWLTAGLLAGEGEDQGCSECHSNEDTEYPYQLPVDKWLLDAHSQSAINPRFLTMYAGTDISGNQSLPTNYGYHRDYGRIPLQPDSSQPYYGPGYKLDFPTTQGNCASCHAPVAAVNTPYGVDPTTLTGIAAEGVTCDFCHKVWGVNLDSTTGLPQKNMPGVLSYEFRRPFGEHQFFAGPYDDVAPGEDTYSKLQQESQYCAPCHFGTFWDTVVYDSFGEWLNSSYSDPETGQTCQDCHMPQVDVTHFANPEKGGLERDPETIFSHLMPGASDETLLQNAVEMTATAQSEGDTIKVCVNIVNNNTGHHVPTDSPLRHMILLIKATNAKGAPLVLVEGPTLPEWCGIGDVSDGYYAGLPGKAYAKILQELWTDIAPSGAYWNPTRILSDNRIPAMEEDTTVFNFAIPSDGRANIEIELLFRRSFIKLMNQKGWDMPDILMEHESLLVDALE